MLNVNICIFKWLAFILIFFHPLEVVDRVTETQLQVGENLNQIKNEFVVFNQIKRKLLKYSNNDFKVIIKLQGFALVSQVYALSLTIFTE